MLFNKQNQTSSSGIGGLVEWRGMNVNVEFTYLKVIIYRYLFLKYVVGYSRIIAYKTYHNLVPI